MEEDLLDLTPKRKEACGCFCFPKKTINNKPQQEADAISIVAPDANFFVVANKGTDISGGSNGGKAKASVPMYIEVPVVIIMADTSSSPATTEATTINSISSCSDNDSHRCSSASSEPRRVELDAYYDAEAVITGSTRQKKGNDHKDEHEIHPSWYNTRHEMSDGGDDDDAGSTDAVLNALIEQAESDLQQQNSILENDTSLVNDDKDGNSSEGYESVPELNDSDSEDDYVDAKSSDAATAIFRLHPKKKSGRMTALMQAQQTFFLAVMQSLISFALRGSGRPIRRRPKLLLKNHPDGSESTFESTTVSSVDVPMIAAAASKTE